MRDALPGVGSAVSFAEAGVMPETQGAVIVRQHSQPDSDRSFGLKLLFQPPVDFPEWPVP